MNVCVRTGSSNRAMADGKMECVPKKEIKECFYFWFLSYFFFILVEDDGITSWGGESDDM